MQSRKTATVFKGMILNQEAWKTIILQCSSIVILSTLLSHCEAQCESRTISIVASNDTQSISSPNHPNSYPEDTSCSWLISSPMPAGRLQLEVVYKDFSCCCANDHLVIRDGSNSSARIIAYLCSELKPITITSSGPNIYGEFKSDSDGQTGFGYTLNFTHFDSKYCPPGWIERSGYCYRLYDPLPWQQAILRCGFDGGFLSSVVDKDENNFIVDSFQNETASLVWLGLNRDWQWLDGLSPLFYNFDNRSGESSGCSAIDINGNGRWQLANCDEQLKFICKKTKDGSGGRYWAEFLIGDDDTSTNIFSTAVAVIIGIGVVFCCTRRRSNNNNNNSNCQCGSCIGEIASCIRNVVARIFERISRGISALGRALLFVVSCKCLRGVARSEETGTGEAPSEQNPQTYQQEVSLEGTPSVTRGSERSGGTDPQSPPAYGDISSVPPPPSYSEALDPQFNFRTNSTSPTNVRETIAAPSYESIVGSVGNVDASVYVVL
nr:uncharacterized protein LOC129270946 [Lytechinus pictus]